MNIKITSATKSSIAQIKGYILKRKSPYDTDEKKESIDEIRTLIGSILSEYDKKQNDGDTKKGYINIENPLKPIVRKN
jgi:hypothetical protein